MATQIKTTTRLEQEFEDARNMIIQRREDELCGALTQAINNPHIGCSKVRCNGSMWEGFGTHRSCGEIHQWIEVTFKISKDIFGLQIEHEVAVCMSLTIGEMRRCMTWVSVTLPDHRIICQRGCHSISWADPKISGEERVVQTDLLIGSLEDVLVNRPILNGDHAEPLTSEEMHSLRAAARSCILLVRDNMGLLGFIE